jgi:hypothetical protein
VDEQIQRPGTEPGRQQSDALLEDPGRHTSPPGMKERQGPALRIDQEYRHAIGHRDSEENPGNRGGMAIRVR